MTRRKVLLIAVTVVVLVGGILGGIQIVGAIQGGDTNTDMTKSVARITYLGQTWCSGSVVGDGWVLTALHCYPGSLDANSQSWRQMGVQLWKDGANVSPGYESLLSERPIPMPGGFVSPDADKQPNYQDVLLLHVATPMPSWVKTIPMALAWPPLKTTLTEYGYGKLGDGKVPDVLKGSKQGAITRRECPPVPVSTWKWSPGHLCTSNDPSKAEHGDSGGPLLWWINGYWQQVGSTIGAPPRPEGTPDTVRYFWSEADGDTRNWILSTVGASFPFGTILRDPASGYSWLYESDGYRHWIPDGGTYNCLLSNSELKVAYVNLPLRTIEALPDMANMRDQWATCTPKPVPTSPPAPTVTLTTTTHAPPTVTPPPPPTVTPHSTASTAPYETAGGVAHTWTNYTNAGGTEGPSVAAYQTVKMSCRLTGFKVADGNTWWYRIAQSPWNNGYYVSADAFYNNGQTSGSLGGTPWVDTNIPICSAPPLPPTPTPQPQQTWSETAGPPSGSGTFTNYMNAGGTLGPRIAAYQTVQISCKLTGFAVADGNNWWYRVASSPWSSAYYAPADNFYNNGQTSGSLSGTPFVDPNVPNC